MAKKALNETVVREKLGEVQGWGEAHVDWKKAVDGLEESKRGTRPPGIPHSPWELLEHTRIALWDIVEFTRDPKHKSPEWPSGYWPKSPAPADSATWDKSVKELLKGIKELEKLINDPKIPLDGKIPHGSGQTLLRQALLAADHNAYHLGQFVLVRRALDDWKGN
jgi:DinB superfamily